MATHVLERVRTEPIKQALPTTGGRMYAIAFDMDIESLRQHYGDPYNNAYMEIRRILERFGFRWQQGSTYFGGESDMRHGGYGFVTQLAVVCTISARYTHVAH